MKTMNRIIALALGLIMTLMLGSCGKTETPGNTNSPGSGTGTSSSTSANSSTSTKERLWPKGDVEILIGFSAGAGSDMLARAMAQYIDLDGHAMVCTNMTGSSGTIALMECYNRPGDGLTMAVCLPEVFNSLIMRGTVESDLWDNLEVIGSPVFDPYVICTAGSSGLETLEDLVEYSKNDTVTIAVAGTGIMRWLSFGIFEQTDLEKVKCLTYSDGNDSRTAVLGGHAVATLINACEAKAYYDSGDFNVVGVASEERLPFMENAPTFKEQGVDFVFGQHRGFCVSPGTPDEVCKEIEARLYEVYQNPEFIDYMNNTLGYYTDWCGREEYKELCKNLQDKLSSWRDIAEQYVVENGKASLNGPP